MPLLLLTALCQGAAGGIGGSSGAYLRPPMGAAATALGGAYTAAPDWYAAWWNPAVLGFLRETRAAAGVGLRSLGRTDGYGSFEFRIPPRAGMGLLLLYRGDPFLNKLYDNDGNPLPAAGYTTLTFKGALSYYATRKLSLGVCLSGMHQSLPVYGDAGNAAYASATGIGALDLAAVYRATAAWTFSAVIKNMGATMEWQMGEYAPLVKDQPLPAVVFASRFLTAAQKKPLYWLFDCKGYVFDGSGKTLDRPEAVISTGAEWRRWDNFYVRAGLGDVSLTGDLRREPDRFMRESGMRIAAGFSYDLSKRAGRKMWINYGAATDKVWAGIEQQLDVTYSF